MVEKTDLNEEVKKACADFLKALDKKDNNEKEVRETGVKALVGLGKFFKNFAEEKGEEFKSEVGLKAKFLFDSTLSFTSKLGKDIADVAEKVLDSVEIEFEKEKESTPDESKPPSSDENNKKSEDELLEIRSKTMNTSYANLVKAGFCTMTATKIVGDISRDMYDKPLGNPQCEKLYTNYKTFEDDEDGLRHTKELAAAMLHMAKK
jgi:hypothetical protein